MAKISLRPVAAFLTRSGNAFARQAGYRLRLQASKPRRRAGPLVLPVRPKQARSGRVGPTSLSMRQSPLSGAEFHAAWSRFFSGDKLVSGDFRTMLQPVGYEPGTAGHPGRGTDAF